MNARPLVGSIKIPRTPVRGVDVFPWANDVNNALQQLRDRKAWYSPKGGKGRSILPRFWPEFQSLTEGETTTYTVTVTEGYVADHDHIGTTSGVEDELDEIAYFPVPNQFTGDALTKFDIEDGQAIYVKVAVLSTGEIGITSGDECEIAIESDGILSTHHIPATSTPTASGSTGTYYYKLAIFRVVEGVASLELFLAGDNIVHHRPRGINSDVTFLTSSVTIDGTSHTYNAFTLCFRNGRLVNMGSGASGPTSPADLVNVMLSP